MYVVCTTADLAPQTVGVEIRGECVVEFASEHAAPVLGLVEVFGVHREVWLVSGAVGGRVRLSFPFPMIFRFRHK